MGLHKLRRISQWLLPIVAVVLSLLLLFGGDVATGLFRYERSPVAAGELWRLVSGHFVHLGWSHFLLNAAGLGLVWFLVGDAFDNRGWIIVTVVSICVMDLGFWLLNPELKWYVGLSGLLHGLLAAGLVANARSPSAETIVMAVLLVSKLCWEQFSGGPLPGSEASSGGAVVVDAHLYGTIGGILGLFVSRIRARRSAQL